MARSWIFDLVGGVSISRCGCELCLVGVVFDVALRVGVIFLLWFLQSSCHLLVFVVVLAWKVVLGSLVVVLALALVC